MNYSTEEEHNHTLADIIINNCASNDSFGSGILTQPPDNETTFTYTNNNMEADMHHQAKQAASNKRKSKLKKSKSSSSKSVLETMSAENSADFSTSGAPTTTADTAETKDVSPYPIDLTNSPSPQKVQAAHPTITPASKRIVEQRKSATLPDPSSSSVAASSLKENNEVKVAPKKTKAKKSKTSTEDIASTKSQSTTSKSAAKSTGNNTKQQLLAKRSPTKKMMKKKRSFHDQILYTMSTSCKPYTLKSLAKATDTTVEALRHAMLSFVDKKLVLTKEFPSKKDSTREPKKLYWANPLTMSQIESSNEGNKGKGGGVAKQLSKLLSTTDEIQEANTILQKLNQQHRVIQDELRPLLAIPTMKQLDDDNIAEEEKLTQVQNEIQAVKDRIANALTNKESATAPNNRMSQGYTSAAYYSANRFQQPKQSTPQDKTTLKRKINHMLSEYKTRKRICMDCK